MSLNVSYGALSTSSSNLTACWQRIESLLGELDRRLATTRDMKAELLTAYLALKARWDADAGDRQRALRELAAYLQSTRESYQRMDQMLAQQFV